MAKLSPGFSQQSYKGRRHNQKTQKFGTMLLIVRGGTVGKHIAPISSPDTTGLKYPVGMRGAGGRDKQFLHTLGRTKKFSAVANTLSTLLHQFLRTFPKNFRQFSREISQHFLNAFSILSKSLFGIFQQFQISISINSQGCNCMLVMGKRIFILR